MRQRKNSPTKGISVNSTRAMSTHEPSAHQKKAELLSLNKDILEQILTHLSYVASDNRATTPHRGPLRYNSRIHLKAPNPLESILPQLEPTLIQRETNFNDIMLSIAVITACLLTLQNLTFLQPYTDILFIKSNEPDDREINTFILKSGVLFLLARTIYRLISCSLSKNSSDNQIINLAKFCLLVSIHLPKDTEQSISTIEKMPDDKEHTSAVSTSIRNFLNNQLNSPACKLIQKLKHINFSHLNNMQPELISLKNANANDIAFSWDMLPTYCKLTNQSIDQLRSSLPPQLPQRLLGKIIRNQQHKDLIKQFPDFIKVHQSFFNSMNDLLNLRLTSKTFHDTLEAELGFTVSDSSTAFTVDEHNSATQLSPSR